MTSITFPGILVISGFLLQPVVLVEYFRDSGARPPCTLGFIRGKILATQIEKGMSDKDVAKIVGEPLPAAHVEIGDPPDGYPTIGVIVWYEQHRVRFVSFISDRVNLEKER